MQKEVAGYIASDALVLPISDESVVASLRFGQRYNCLHFIERKPALPALMPTNASRVKAD